MTARAHEARHRVETWLFATLAEAQEVEAAAALLSDDERARARRFTVDGAGARFIIAHARLRQILAAAVELSPEAMAFEIGPRGKPILSRARLPAGQASDPPHFNLSHAGDWAAVALCWSAPVGIDIERVRDVDLRLARRYFAPAEADAVMREADAFARRLAFFRTWTAKEAYVKALGEGIAHGLERFEVATPPGSGWSVVATTAGAALETGRTPAHWTLSELAAPPGYVGALAVAAPPGDVVIVAREP
ncbi:MAG: 4'-phosphopantetheinyl transferase superfamily protein [Hyphomicrobiaceae bacterium]|nr:4'-phosphopantetheinyl transferase superfamily protein [Hyphomicrobiaceae bacterium]